MNPWKLTAIAMGVVMATALVTGLVVANWTAGDRATQEQRAQQKVVQATPARVASMPAAPSQSAIAACNKYAASEAGSKDKTLKLYEGHVHDLLNDLGKEAVMADIKVWIEARLPRA